MIPNADASLLDLPGAFGAGAVFDWRARNAPIALTVRHVASDADFAALRADWGQLYDLVEDAHPSTRFEWITAWRDFATVRRPWLVRAIEAFAVTDSASQALVAVIPFQRTEVKLGLTSVRWIRMGIPSAFTELTRLLILPAATDAAVDAVQRYAATLSPSAVIWTGLQQDTDATRALFAQGGTQSGPETPTLYIDLPRSWDAFEARLSRKMRRTLRTNRRALAKRAPRAQFDVLSSAGDVQGAIGPFTALFRERLRKHGRSAAVAHLESGLRHFLPRSLRQLAQHGLVRVFRLQADGEPVAMRFGLVHGSDIHLHLFADDSAWRKQGVLTLVMADAIRHAIEHGYRRIYLAASMHKSNLRWSPEVVHCAQVAIWTPGAKGALLRMLRTLRQSLQRRARHQ